MNRWCAFILITVIGLVAIAALRDFYVSRLMDFSMKELVTSGNLDDTLRRRIRIGGDPNAVSEEGDPLICLAVSVSYNGEIIRVLLEEGALVNVTCKNGKSPYFIAVEVDNFEALEMLFLYGGPPSNEQLGDLLEVSKSKRVTSYLEQFRTN